VHWIPVVAPILVALTALVISWDAIKNRSVYFLTGILIVTGAQTICRIVLDAGSDSDSFVESVRGLTLEHLGAVDRRAQREAVIAALAAAIASTPLLRYVALAFRR
jgi:hypothetical protein